MKREFWKSSEFWITVFIAPLVAGVIAAVIATGTFWGRPVGFSWSSILLMVFSGLFTWGMIAFGFRWGRKSSVEEIASLNNKHTEETAILKRKAITVSIAQPKGMTFFPLKPGLLCLYLYIKTATPLESKDAQAAFNVGGYPVVLRAEGVIDIPVSQEGTKGRCIPLEKTLGETEVEITKELLKLAQTRVPIEHITISPNLIDNGGKIAILPLDFTTFVEVTS